MYKTQSQIQTEIRGTTGSSSTSTSFDRSICVSIFGSKPKTSQNKNEGTTPVFVKRKDEGLQTLMSSSGFNRPNLNPATITTKRTSVFFSSSPNVKSSPNTNILSTTSSQPEPLTTTIPSTLRSISKPDTKNILTKQYSFTSSPPSTQFASRKQQLKSPLNSSMMLSSNISQNIHNNMNRSTLPTERKSLFQSLGFDKNELIKSKSNLTLQNSVKAPEETFISYGDNQITGSYSIDLNIYSIDKYVIKRIQENMSSKFNILVNNKEDIQSKIRKPQTKLARSNCKKKIREIYKKIKNLREELDLKSYTERSKAWLDAYTKLGSSNKVIVFNDSKTNEQSDPPTDEQEIRAFVIQKYLSIAGEYISINLRKRESFMTRCDQCDEKLSLSDPNEDGNVFCPSCGKKYETYNHSYQDDDDYQYFNKSSNLDEFINNMKAVIKKYKGDHIPKLPSNWTERLDSYFEKRPNNRPSISSINSKEGADGTKLSDGDHVKAMLEALADKEVKMSKNYDDVHYICYVYWDLELPDIGDIEHKIIEDCKNVYPIYIENKGERKSNMGYWYLLWRCLDRHSFECSPNDFKIVSTDEILDWYENMWKLFCSKLKWEHPEPIQKKKLSRSY